MRSAVALLSLIWIGGVALAEVTPSAPAPTAKPAADTGAAPTAVPVATKAKRVRRGRGIRKAATKTATPGTPHDPLASCLELWEATTHMTRSEWARACRRVDDRLKTVTFR